jgi:beta-lactam-binding protein with PASTA domain
MKTILNFLKSKFLWLNLLAAIVLVFVVCWVVFWRLDVYTRHGESVEVPDLSGMYVEEAELILKDCDLTYEIIDSVYIRNMKGGEIAEQSPAVGTLVKKNRKIYLTINSKQRKMVIVPNLVGESRRKVQSNLKTLGFNVDSVRYEPYEFNDEVLSLMWGDSVLAVGSRVPDGSQIILVVGQNDMSIEVVVPSFLGMTLPEAKKTIEEYRLGFGAAHFDEMPIDGADSLKYRVYQQTPDAGLSVYGGKAVELKLSKGTQEIDEDFF